MLNAGGAECGPPADLSADVRSSERRRKLSSQSVGGFANCGLQELAQPLNLDLNLNLSLNLNISICSSLNLLFLRPPSPA
jgi:hypothetical protein